MQTNFLPGLEPPPPPPKHSGTCLHCYRKITAQTSAEWSKTVKGPCPHCHKKGW